jgi:ABC-type nickel/cobalt efflux system permease component RcnA
MEHVPHPHLEKRKDFLKRHRESAKGFNNRLAVAITNTVGTMWCAYAFAILALISLPEAIKAGISALIAWIAQTFLQLVLLSIIMVGQKVAAEKSDRQLEQTYMDAEALLQISDDMHRLLKQNTLLTEQINELIREPKKA